MENSPKLQASVSREAGMICRSRYSISEPTQDHHLLSPQAIHRLHGKLGELLNVQCWCVTLLVLPELVSLVTARQQLLRRLSTFITLRATVWSPGW